MNIVELLAQYREESRDDNDPPFVSDTAVVGLFNEAEKEACRRKKMLFDATTTAVCQIAVTSATATYTLHTAIEYVTKAYLVDSAGVITYLTILCRDELDRINQLWREDTDNPSILVVDEKTCQIVPPPLQNYTMKLEVYRTPLVAMFLPVDPVPIPAPDPLISLPEIAERHHDKLYHWVLYRAFNKPDADMYSPDSARTHEAAFSRYFGRAIPSDRRRNGRVNTPHKNKVWL